MRFLFKAHCTKLSKTAFFIESALIKIIITCASYSKRTLKTVKNAFFTKSALIKIIKICASYSKRTVQNSKRTRSLLKVHLLKSLKHALLIQSALYKIVIERVLY